MEVPLLPAERTELVSTNKLEHGCAYQKLANQSATFNQSTGHPLLPWL